MKQRRTRIVRDYKNKGENSLNNFFKTPCRQDMYVYEITKREKIYVLILSLYTIYIKFNFGL